MRFDDTNPVKEDQEYVDSIMDDVRWLVSGSTKGWLTTSSSREQAAEMMLYAFSSTPLSRSMALRQYAKYLMRWLSLVSGTMGVRKGSVGRTDRL